MGECPSVVSISWIFIGTSCCQRKWFDKCGFLTITFVLILSTICILRILYKHFLPTRTLSVVPAAIAAASKFCGHQVSKCLFFWAVECSYGWWNRGMISVCFVPPPKRKDFRSHLLVPFNGIFTKIDRFWLIFYENHVFSALQVIFLPYFHPPNTIFAHFSTENVFKKWKYVHDCWKNFLKMKKTLGI